mmetsp:Transcript_13592/g.37539  ORF Transcript_13592/g.37539 Transcript_13592/m.37539 type:complete len:201 (-) Transcript_13592:372-974(-)
MAASYLLTHFHELRQRPVTDVNVNVKSHATIHLEETGSGEILQFVGYRRNFAETGAALQGWRHQFKSVAMGVRTDCQQCSRREQFSRHSTWLVVVLVVLAANTYPPPESFVVVGIRSVAQLGGDPNRRPRSIPVRHQIEPCRVISTVSTDGADGLPQTIAASACRRRRHCLLLLLLRLFNDGMLHHLTGTASSAQGDGGR